MKRMRAGPAVALGAMVFAGFGVFDADAPRAAEAQDRQTAVPIDRWLVAAPDIPDGLEPETRLATDLLAAPGEIGVTPQRGERAGGAAWHLLRRDGQASVELDSKFPDARSLGLVVYAHSYLRLARDRTLRLDWGGSDCTSARAWLNGRELPTAVLDVRLGAGWNTLLLKLLASDCPLGFHATLTAPDGDTADDVLVRASRPYGDVRTGPEDWVVIADTARFDAHRRWRGDRLYAGLVVALTAWGRAPVSGVELELPGMPDGRTSAPWLVPGVSGEVVVPVRLDRLDRLLGAGRADVRLRWPGQQVNRTITVSGPAPAASRRVALDGWQVRRTGGDPSGASAGRIPNAPGWLLEGAWRVPEAIAGRTLVLESDAAPADYVVNGSPARTVGGAVQLCSPCARGVRLRLSATSTDAWTTLPTVRVEDEAGG